MRVLIVEPFLRVYNYYYVIIILIKLCEKLVYFVSINVLSVETSELLNIFLRIRKFSWILASANTVKHIYWPRSLFDHVLFR